MPGLGFVVLMLAVNMLTNQKVGGYQEQLMTIGDQRLKIISEVLDGIKVSCRFSGERKGSRKK